MTQNVVAILLLIVAFGLGAWVGAVVEGSRWRGFADKERNVPSDDGYYSVERRGGPVE